MKVCIAIPIYNEAKAIGDIVEAIRARRLDVVVIDDGSSDGGGVIAQAKGAAVITHEGRKGKGVSLQDGFGYIVRHGYDGVITMDGDGQHAVEDLEGFLKKAEQFPQDIVAGTRMDQCANMPWLRRTTNRFMSWLISLVCKQNIPDTQCGYRYISRAILQQIQLTCKDFEIESEVLIQASRRGFRVHAAPVKTIYRDEKSKINPLRDTIRFFIYISKEFFRR
ncbi:MAG: hypothetical protein A2787_08280 [Omnitrophica WOR_2 bacterium RIFCSPHIGHO2_01_FULL_48_9]|nr:MAG: hypothetical protein A3D10_08040 [Omnitrophica WOR_2 bacterium RIFCSPHIGHO2_02_FULL_48_11]OGX33341.1 MAG: hypothetical protein A2787_08280 [Omnitrophica WOR_2 bacterium RIFCSPHIGHO2_01_FULL_48_9]